VAWVVVGGSSGLGDGPVLAGRGSGPQPFPRTARPPGLRTTYVGQCDMKNYTYSCCIMATWFSCQTVIPCPSGNCPKGTQLMGNCGPQYQKGGESCMFVNSSFSNCQAASYLIATDLCQLTGNLVNCNPADPNIMGCEYQYTSRDKSTQQITVCTCSLWSSLCDSQWQPAAPCFTK
jgi:hypothetical protein